MCMLVLCSRYGCIAVLLSFFIYIIAVLWGSIARVVSVIARCERAGVLACGGVRPLQASRLRRILQKNEIGSPSNQGHPRPDTARGVGPKGRAADGTQRLSVTFCSIFVLPLPLSPFQFSPFPRFSPHNPKFLAIFSVHLGRFAWI